MTAIADFKQLLIESKAEIDAEKGETTSPQFAATVLAQITTILTEFEEAKQSIKVVGKKNGGVKTMLEQPREGSK